MPQSQPADRLAGKLTRQPAERPRAIRPASSWLRQIGREPDAAIIDIAAPYRLGFGLARGLILWVCAFARRAQGADHGSVEIASDPAPARGAAALAPLRADHGFLLTPEPRGAGTAIVAPDLTCMRPCRTRD